MKNKLLKTLSFCTALLTVVILLSSCADTPKNPSTETVGSSNTASQKEETVGSSGTASQKEETVDPTEAPIVFSMDEVSGKAGENVKTTLTISDNPGILGYQISLLYDKDKLDVVSASIKIGKFSTSNKTVPGTLVVMATDQGENPIDENGVCAEIVFNIKDGALPGEEFTLTPCLKSSADTVFQSGDGYPTYPASFVSGKITVTA